jgi:predicted  nucleic acid-binding Zn-ribbon protein
MNEQLTLLIELQEIDGRLRGLQEQKDRIPAQLAEIEQRIQANRAGLDNARAASEAAQKAKRDRDRDLEEGGTKVEKLKGRSSEIKTNKEYTALLKEIETAEQENKVIEDDILRLMEGIDAAAAEIQAAQTRAAEEGAAADAERKQLMESAAVVAGGIAEAERARSVLLPQIDEEVAAEYLRLVGPKGGKVVVETRNESCSGCYMSIPPQLFVNVKKNEQLLSCPHCHRILYYKEGIKST